MSFKMMVKIFQHVSDLESELNRDPKQDLGESKAKQIYDNFMETFLKFITSRKQLFDELDIENYDREDRNMSIHERMQLFDSIQQKMNRLNTALQKITKTSSESIDECDQIKQQAVGESDSYSHRQKFLKNLIESLEPNDNICADESQIRFDHVRSLYTIFISDQIETINNVSDTNFESRMKLSIDVQQKVISLQTKLKKIIESYPTSSLNSNSNTVEPSQRSNADNESDQTNQFDIIESQREIFEQLKKLHSSESEPNDQSNSSLQTDTTSDYSTSSFDQITSETNQTEHGTSSSQSLEQSNVDDQSDQTKKPDYFDDLSLYSKNQDYIIDTINHLRSTNFARCTKSDLQLYEELVTNLRRWFISNFNEMQKYVNCYSLSYRLQNVHDTLAHFDNIQSTIEANSKIASAAEIVQHLSSKLSVKPGTTLPSTSSHRTNIADQSNRTEQPENSQDSLLATYLEKQAKIAEEMRTLRFEKFDSFTADLQMYRDEVTALLNSFLDNQIEICKRVPDGCFYRIQKTLLTDVGYEFQKLLDDIDKTSYAINMS